MTLATLLLILVVLGVLAIAAGVMIGRLSEGNQAIRLLLILGGIIALLAIGGFIWLIFGMMPG